MTNSDLILREEALNTIKSMLYETALNSVESDEDAALLYEDIADNRIEIWLRLVDTVDAVPVVRCRDCKHSFENAKHIDVACEWSSDPDFYCADGERRDDDGKDA